MRSCWYIAITLLLFMSCGCSGQKKSVAEQQQPESEARFAAYAAQNGVSVDWQAALPSGSVTDAYTFQLEDALKKRKTIAVRAMLKDVKRKGDAFVLSLKGEGNDDGIHLTLSATPDHVAKILKQGTGIYDEYGVIVRVTGIERPEFSANAESDPDLGQRVSIDDSDFVIIRGECVDLTFLEGLGLPKTAVGK